MSAAEEVAAAHREGTLTTPPPIFDESTGRALNDRARVLLGQEPKGYDEVSSIDEAQHLAAARSKPVTVPRSEDEWYELLGYLTEDSEKPAHPKFVDALAKALDRMSGGGAPMYIDSLGRWLEKRLSQENPNVTLKCLKVMITLMDGGVGIIDDDETEPPPGLATRMCTNMANPSNMWAAPAPAPSGLSGALTAPEEGSGGGSGPGGGRGAGRTESGGDGAVTYDGGGVGEHSPQQQPRTCSFWVYHMQLLFSSCCRGKSGNCQQFRCG